MEDYVASTIEVTINDFGEKYIDGKTVTFYKIEINIIINLLKEN